MNAQTVQPTSMAARPKQPPRPTAFRLGSMYGRAGNIDPSSPDAGFVLPSFYPMMVAGRVRTY